MDETRFRAWLDELVARHPMVTEVVVTGTRVLPHSRRKPRCRTAEWEVVVFLDEETCYHKVPCHEPLKERYRVLDAAAARIAADAELRSPEIDLYVWGPGWRAVSWEDRAALELDMVEVHALRDNEAARLAAKLASSVIAWERPTAVG